MRPFITVVMPVRNEARFILDTLMQLVQQDYPADSYEIIVVDGMSDDGTRTIVEDTARIHPQIHLMDNPKRLSSAGRNIGFRNGKGDYFLVVDGHCFIPDDQLIKSIVNAFAKSRADCLGRPQQLDPPGLTDFQKAVAVARSAKIGHSGASFIFSDFEGFISPQSNGAAYRRDVFEKVGYVDETFDAAEDLEFNYRLEKAGLTCYTCRQLMVKYYPRETISRLFKQLTRYGMGRCKFIRKHPQAMTINQLIPFFFVLGIPLAIGCTILMLVWNTYSIPLLLTVLPYFVYLILISIVSVMECAYSSFRLLPVLPLIFLTIHVALGWGFFRGFKTRLFKI